MFVTTKAQDLLTYSRSTTGTYIGSDGLLKTAAVDEARIEYDGSGNVQGLLLEPISTNQWTNSTTFTGQWGHNGTLTGGQSPDPAGGSSAYLWTDVDTAGGQDQLNATKSGITASGDNRWTASIFVRKPPSAPAGTEFEHWNFLTGGTLQDLYTRWEFDSNGAISLTSQGNGGAGTSVPFNVGYDTLANGWYRIYQTFFDASGNNTNVQQRIFAGRRAAGYTGSLLVYGPQLEQNHMVTSYIPTTGVEGTRQPDIAYIDTDQFGVKQDRGTIVAEINNLKWHTAQSSASYQRVIEFGNTTNTTDRIIPLIVKTDTNLLYAEIITDATYQASYQHEDYADSADVGPFSAKIAIRYDETSARPAQDGVLIGNDLSISDIEGERPYRTRLVLRNQSQDATGNGSDIRFHIKSLQYYPRKLSNYELQRDTDPGTLNTFEVSNTGGDIWTIDGQAGNNPTLSLDTATTYKFNINSPTDAFYITTDDGTDHEPGQFIDKVSYSAAKNDNRLKSNEHGLSEWYCFDSTNATYSAIYPNTTIYEEYNGTATIKVGATTKPQSGTIAVLPGRKYYANRPIHLIGLQENNVTLTSQGDVVPLTVRGLVHGHIGRDDVSNGKDTIYDIYAPFGAGSVAVYDDVATGIDGTATTTINVSANGTAQYTTSSNNKYVMFKSTVPVVISTYREFYDPVSQHGDTGIVYPASTHVYSHITGGYYRTVTNTAVDGSGSSTGYVTYDSTDKVFQATHGDGGGLEGQVALGYEYLSDTYSYGGVLSDFVIVAPYASTSITVSYWSDSDEEWKVGETFSLNGSKTSPAQVQRDGTLGFGVTATTLSGAANNFISNTTDIWKWEGNNPFFLRLNAAGDPDEESMLGWMSSRTELTGDREYTSEDDVLYLTTPSSATTLYYIGGINDNAKGTINVS